MELIVKNPTTAAPLPAVEWNYQEMRAELEKNWPPTRARYIPQHRCRRQKKTAQP